MNQMIKPILVIRLPYCENNKHEKIINKSLKVLTKRIQEDYHVIYSFERVDSMQFEIIECKSNSTPTETTSN